MNEDNLKNRKEYQNSLIEEILEHEESFCCKERLRSCIINDDDSEEIIKHKEMLLKNECEQYANDWSRFMTSEEFDDYCGYVHNANKFWRLLPVVGIIVGTMKFPILGTLIGFIIGGFLYLIIAYSNLGHIKDMAQFTADGDDNPNYKDADFSQKVIVASMIGSGISIIRHAKKSFKEIKDVNSWPKI